MPGLAGQGSGESAPRLPGGCQPCSLAPHPPPPGRLLKPPSRGGDAGGGGGSTVPRAPAPLPGRGLPSPGPARRVRGPTAPPGGRAAAPLSPDTPPPT